MQAQVQKSLNQINHIVAVASGKGGVGKSTTAVNLALALKAEGATVGLLDADIYGPNQPMMLGSSQKAHIKENKKFEPVVRHGLPTMSMGYLVDENTPMVWRGPMVSMALQQMLYDTDWPSLDYLVVDLPPGTGDVQLTLAKKARVSGAVIVTTPQNIALADVKKAMNMLDKVKIRVLGVVENMSHYVCPQCGHQDALFGKAGGVELAHDNAVPLLAQIPLTRSIREQMDEGTPTVWVDPEGELSQRYRQAAVQLMAQLPCTQKPSRSKFPDIVVE